MQEKEKMRGRGYNRKRLNKKKRGQESKRGRKREWTREK